METATASPLRGRARCAAAVAALLLLAAAAPAPGGVTASLSGGYDSNVNRAVGDGTGDGFASARIGIERDPDAGKRLDPILSAAVSGTAYAELSDLSSVGADADAGVTYAMTHWLLASVSAFGRGRLVRDDAQSAWAIGGSGGLLERLSRTFYLAQSYTYTDSRAREEVYSYSEHALSVVAGATWTSALSTEIWYGYARGDSFRTVETASAVATAKGKGNAPPRYSTVYGGIVFREPVDRHTVGAAAEVAVARGTLARADYAYEREEGDSGVSESHSVTAALEIRF